MPMGDDSDEDDDDDVDMFKLLGDDDEIDDEPIPEGSDLDPAALAGLDPTAAQAHMRSMAAPLQRGVDTLEDEDDDYVFPDPIP